MLYDVEEVASKVGLSPVTIRYYLKPYGSDLVRGKDYVLWRYAAGRRRFRVTDRGLERLALGQYRAWSWSAGHRPTPAKPKDYGTPRLKLTGPRAERLGYLQAAMFHAVRRYLETPCAVPNCPCIIHKLGVPQADVVQVIMKRDGWVDAFGKFHRFNDYQRRDTDK